MSGSGRETHLDIREWTECPPGCQEMVSRPSQMSGSGWVALMDVREWSGDTHGCP